MNTPAISARSLLQLRFLLDHRGENQRLPGLLEGQPRCAARPGRGQRALHGLVRQGEDRRVRGVGRKAVGIREEAPLGVFTGVTDGAHDLGSGLAVQRVRHGGVRGERGEELGKGRALDDGQLLQHHFAFGEQREDRLRAGMRGDLVHPGLDAHLAVLEAQPPGHRARIRDRALCLQVIEDRAQTRARGDLDARHLRLRAGGSVGVLQPVIAEGGRRGGQH